MTVFHSDNLANWIKAYVANMTQSYSVTKFGIVKEYDPETNTVIVGYYNHDTDDFDLDSNWLKLLVPTNGIGEDSEAGDGELWGHHYGPNIGEQVLVLSIDGDHNNGIVVGSIFTDLRPPPTVDGEYTESGEFLWKHRTGSYIKFWNNGDISIYATGDLNLHADGDMNTHIGGQTTFLTNETATFTGNSVMLNAKGTVHLEAPGSNSSGVLSAGNGASGSFTTPTGKTVTVMNGIITNIF